MKIKILALAAAPLLLIQTGCQSTSNEQTSSSKIHGSAGVGVQSRDTSHISPERPAY